jgi:hypothetical protein
MKFNTENPLSKSRFDYTLLLPTLLSYHVRRNTTTRNMGTLIQHIIAFLAVLGLVSAASISLSCMSCDVPSLDTVSCGGNEINMGLYFSLQRLLSMTSGTSPFMLSMLQHHTAMRTTTIQLIQASQSLVLGQKLRQFHSAIARRLSKPTRQQS